MPTTNLKQMCVIVDCENPRFDILIAYVGRIWVALCLNELAN
jgi:hypothetical protein